MDSEGFITNEQTNNNDGKNSLIYFILIIN